MKMRQPIFRPDQEICNYARTLILAAVVAIMMVRMLLNLAVDVFSGRMGTAMGNAFVRDLRSAIFNHLQLLSFGFFDKRQTGALHSRVAYDTERLQGFILEGALHFLPNALILLIIVIVLFFMNWKLALWALLPAPLVFFGTLFGFKRFVGLIHRFFGARARLGAEVTDAISGIRVVRAFGQEQKSIARFEERNDELYEAQTGFERYIFTVFTLLGGVSQLGFFLIYLLGGYMVLRDEISVGMFMAFTMYLGMFMPAVRTLSRVGEWLSRSLAAAQRVFDVLDTEPEVRSLDEGVDLTPVKGAIAFENVTFGYDPFKPILKGVTLEVKPGEMIGLVGESGVGKTTITNLICRFYDVPEDGGRVLVDGVPIKQVRLRALRRQIGVVLQEPFLFQGTIAENVAFSKPDATMDEIIAAARAANAHDFIMKFTDGYESQVGERGGRLSAGEKQRVSIARAILHDPRILILDEATSSVDTATESKIQEALERLTAGRTTFAIAHRLSTLRKADRLVVLEKGVIAETGTHQELMDKKGAFWKLVTVQKEASGIIEVGG
ncbi:MAG: ABC transporter ATP-binding protein [Planctomycetota bacterium]